MRWGARDRRKSDANRACHSSPAQVSGDSDRNFSVATLVSNRSTVSSGRLFQRNDRADKGLQNSSVKHLCNFKQLFLVSFDDEECIFHPLVRSAFAVRDDGYYASADFSAP